MAIDIHAKIVRVNDCARMVRKIPKANVLQAAKQAAVPPAPFTKAPTSLEPFLEHLDPAQVYLVHVDNFPVDFKKRIFTVPVILNLSIALGLLWRLLAAAPVYMALIASVLGRDSPETVDTATKTNKQLVWLLLKRTLTFAFDFVLFRFISPWPFTFFFESPANPVYWRWKIGFRNLEVVVRESRKWGGEELLRGVKQGSESPFFKTRIQYAIDNELLRTKTGYMLMDKNWDLDFHAMIAAHQFLDQKKIPLKEFGKSVLAFDEGLGGWTIWQVWKIDDEGADEENRKKIVALKDRLTAMGKENLFFRWIEIVQYESGQSGSGPQSGFTPERQQITLKKVQEAFTEQGVDFEALIRDVGGLEGTPGMERTS